MASLIEEEVYEDIVYLIEITDAVIGGANGIANLQAKQLANRTAWLKANKQDKDATLTALAALVTAADEMIYATGSDTFSTTTLTAFARTLLDDVDAAAMRATLGAQPTGSYQASDATLTALAALVTAADKMIYATGSDTFSTTTLTAFARTLLDDVDAATMKATLGIPTGTLLTDGGHSYSGNGYQKLSSGLIIQWGYSAAGEATFPLSFPNACLNVVVQIVSSGSAFDAGHVNPTFNTTGFTRTIKTVPCRWIAIGY